MCVNLVVLGLIFDIVGVFIITITTIINPRYQRREDVKWWDKRRYWWNGWKPLYKNTETKKWCWNWKRKPIVEWIIPPKHQLEIFGFLLILIGFWLQLIFYLS